MVCYVQNENDLLNCILIQQAQSEAHICIYCTEKFKDAGLFLDKLKKIYKLNFFILTEKECQICLSHSLVIDESVTKDTIKELFLINEKSRIITYQEMEKRSLDNCSHYELETLYHIFSLDSLQLGDIIFIPFICENYSQALKQMQVLELLVNYWGKGSKIQIKRAQGDLYGLYKKWFPLIECIDVIIPKELFIYYLRAKSVKLIDLSSRLITTKLNANWVWLNYSHLSVTKIHLYYVASEIMCQWENSFEFVYAGQDFQLLYGFIKQHLRVNIIVNKPADNIKKSLFILVDDNVDVEMLHYIYFLMEQQEKKTVILFFNNMGKYLFYQPNHTDILKYTIPFSFYLQKGEIEMHQEEYILYPYTTDDNFRKSLITAKIDIGMDKIGIIKKNYDIENIFLRGMLEATERRVLYLTKQLETLKSQ